MLLLDQFKEQELSNVVWAFAKLHYYDSDMFNKLLATVSNKLPHFLPQVCAVWMGWRADRQGMVYAMCLASSYCG